MDLPSCGRQEPRPLQHVPDRRVRDVRVRLPRWHREGQQGGGAALHGRPTGDCHRSHDAAMTEDPELTRGFVDATLRAEFPDLGLVYTEMAVRPGRSPEPVRARLREASNRFTGAKAVALR